MEWLNTLNSWAPVLWIFLSGVLLLIWYRSIRSKHRLDIRRAAVEVVHRQYHNGEITDDEFNRRRQRLRSNNT